MEPDIEAKNSPRKSRFYEPLSSIKQKPKTITNSDKYNFQKASKRDGTNRRRDEIMLW